VDWYVTNEIVEGLQKKTEEHSAAASAEAAFKAI
jgi:hypothetical protein